MNGVRLTTASVVLAIGLVGAAYMVSKFYLSVKHEKAITVKGYAESDLVSDIGHFTCAVSVRGKDLRDAYANLQASKTAVLGFLRQKGFAESEIRADTISTSKVNKKNKDGDELNEVEFFDVSQSVMVASTNVLLIQDASTTATDLIKDGIDISVGDPQYLVSDLKDMKVKLLALATEDGYRRAQALARSSHAKVGGLVSAEQGVIQITRRHSTDTSGGGMYDTSTIDKTMKAIVSLEYTIVAR